VDLDTLLRGTRERWNELGEAEFRAMLGIP
jgi:hypothetical protein